MRIQIGQRPDHGFDEPLGLLSDCRASRRAPSNNQSGAGLAQDRRECFGRAGSFPVNEDCDGNMDFVFRFRPHDAFPPIQ